MGEETERKSAFRYVLFEQRAPSRSYNPNERRLRWPIATREKLKILKYSVVFLLPVIATYAFIHEGAHVIAAILQGEEVLGIQFYFSGIKVLLSTPESAREGVKWGLIAVSGIAFTLSTGYVLYFLRSRWLNMRNAYLKFYIFYLCVVLLFGDPFYYCLYPLLGTGDIVGVSSFLGVPLVFVYLMALLLFAINIFISRVKLARKYKGSKVYRL